jgi:hypothetical protein
MEMAYYMVRFYTGADAQSAEQLLKDLNAQVLPQLQEAGGLIRYVTFIADDGRIGSASVYEDKEAAQRGLQAAQQLASRLDAMKGLQLAQTIEGEIAAALNADNHYEPLFGMGRLFTTESTAAEVVETIKKSRAGAQDDAARPRTVIVQLSDGRVASFAVYDSEEMRDRHTAAISKAQQVPEFKRVLPTASENIPSRIITSSSR